MDSYIRRLLTILMNDYEKGKFVPILEADVIGYIYHLWLRKFGNAQNVHLDTRICKIPQHRFDFVVGKVEDRNVPKPCVPNPQLVIEIKTFPIGYIISM